MFYQKSKIKFYVGGGNNSEVVKRVMNTRNWWIECSQPEGHFLNLQWQQTVRGFRFEKLSQNIFAKQLFNHFEFHHEISNKSGLLKNLQNYCEVQ